MKRKFLDVVPDHIADSISIIRPDIDPEGKSLAVFIDGCSPNEPMGHRLLMVSAAIIEYALSETSGFLRRRKLRKARDVAYDVMKESGLLNNGKIKQELDDVYKDIGTICRYMPNTWERIKIFMLPMEKS